MCLSVAFFPERAADVKDVSMTTSADEADVCAGSRQDSVGCGSRAVGDECVHLIELEIEAIDGVYEALGRIGQRREGLRAAGLAGCHVDQNQVRERAPDVNADLEVARYARGYVVRSSRMRAVSAWPLKNSASEMAAAAGAIRLVPSSVRRWYVTVLRNFPTQSPPL